MISITVLTFSVCLGLCLTLVRADTSRSCITGCNCLISDMSISCNYGATDLTLHSSFETITSKRVVDRFDLSDNKNITRIPNFFSRNVSFVNINIRNVESLTEIEENAFWSSVNTTQSFRLISSSVNNSKALFKAISKFVHLTSVVLNNNKLETIPDYAFGNQKHLSMVIITGNRIRHLGQFAFFSLVSLDFLDLSSNSLKELVNNSFAIESKSGKNEFPMNIRINVRLNRIARISDHSFDKLKRRTNLDISFNNLTELRSNVFKTILRFDSTKIIVKGNKVKCDCGLNWIFSNKTIKTKFSGPLRCADKRYFQNLRQKDFKNCTKNYEIENNLFIQ